MSEQRIFTITSSDLEWPFEGTGPSFETKPIEACWRRVEVDPFPSYPHDVELVSDIASHMAASFPLRFAPTYYVLEFDIPSRTNGYTSREWVYDRHRDDWGGFEPYIVLAGKRTPIHDAMTRYLVAHEYCHAAQWNIEYLLGCDRNEMPTSFERDYMKLRGGDVRYGGGKWHSNVMELIANDMRICVAGVEVDFWPHKGYEHPLRVKEVVEFWERMKREYGKLPSAA